jgi:hypothetical protein
VTVEERDERAVVVEAEMHTARARLNAAMRSMDYKAALAYQMQLDRLEREAEQLRKLRRRRRPD